MSEKYYFVFQNVKMCGQLYHFALSQNMKHEWQQMCIRKFRKLFVFNHISAAIYSIVNCLIVFIIISVLRLEHMNLK